MSFKKFENDKPLLYFHFYKTGGTTMRQYFAKWFHNKQQNRFFLHYANDNLFTCTSQKIKQLADDGITNPVFFGEWHYNNVPSECTQFITLVRDPFNHAVSSFFYLNKNCENTADNRKRLAKHILIDEGPYFDSLLVKEKLTLDNYKQMIAKYFIYIGVFENYKDEIKKISNLLGVFYDEKDPVIKKNSSPYTIPVPEYLRSLHRTKWPLQYAVYDYIKQLNYEDLLSYK